MGFYRYKDIFCCGRIFKRINQLEKSWQRENAKFAERKGQEGITINITRRSSVIAVQRSRKQNHMADIAMNAAVIHSRKSTRRIAEMSKKNPEKNRKAEIKRQIKENDIELKNNMFFLPDDLKKLKGKWTLYVKKGKLVRLDKKQKV